MLANKTECVNRESGKGRTKASESYGFSLSSVFQCIREREGERKRRRVKRVCQESL